MFFDIAKILSGITVFLLGLRFISVYTEKAVGDGFKSLLLKASKNRLVSCGLGAFSTCIAQSSVATNMVAISFLSTGAITLTGACAMVIGTNIGTTITAQIVSLKFAGFFDFSSIGFTVAFIGFLISGKDGKISSLGYSLLGFGLIFIGIEILSNSVESFKEYEWFNRLFLIKSAPILLLNGFFITAICQSSSVVSSMLVVLASQHIIGFSTSVYLLLGANIGTCMPVIFATIKLSESERQVALFNILFNIFGGAIFFFLFQTGGWLTDLLTSTSTSVSRQIANFHTFFNLTTGLISLPLLNVFVKLCQLIVKPNKLSKKEYAQNK